MPSSLWQYWRGLSGWNFYFLVKFGLLWAGYLNFHPLLNLVFAAFLLMPIPRYSLHRLRHWIALPIGFALFWHDTWLPGPESIMSQGESTRPAPLCSHSSRNLSLSHPLPGPGRLLSVEWRCSSTSIACSKRPALGTGASRQPCGPRDSHSKGHLPSLGTGPQIGISALPSGRGRWGRNKPLHRQEHISKPHESGIF